LANCIRARRQSAAANQTADLFAHSEIAPNLCDMKTLDFLTTLRDRDIQVWADGDRLRCSAPAGALTVELRQELQRRKSEILKFLRSAESLAQQQRAIVPLQPRGNGTPIFAVAGHNGDVFCFRALAHHLGADQPFFGLQPPGLDGCREPLTRVEDFAAYFAAQIRTVRPDGPYVIAGYCAGGTIAFELARQLLQEGAEIQALALFGSPFATSYRLLPQLRQRFGQVAERVTRHIRAMTSLPAAERRSYISERLGNLKLKRAAQRQAAPDPVLVWRDQVGRATLAAIRRYTPGIFPGRLSLFWPCKECGGDALALWPSVAQNTGKYFGPDGCDGASMLREPYAATFAELFRQSVQGIQNRKIVLSRESLVASPRWETAQMEASSF
jgi:thioesterase domain-containing protein